MKCDDCNDMAYCERHQNPLCAACESRKTRHLDYGHSEACIRHGRFEDPGETVDLRALSKMQPDPSLPKPVLREFRALQSLAIRVGLTNKLFEELS